MTDHINNINALILIGGKSLRMGTDKSKLVYHNKPQIDFVFETLKTVINANNIFFSTRDLSQIKNKSVITDNYPDYGPFGAILSAFEFDSSKAWLVIAIDLPYVDDNLLRLLIEKRKPSKIATTFKGINKDFPEPLITIWEPKSFKLLQNALKKDNFSLISILKNNEIEIIKIDDKLIQNINTKNEFDSINKHR